MLQTCFENQFPRPVLGYPHLKCNLSTVYKIGTVRPISICYIVIAEFPAVPLLPNYDSALSNIPRLIETSGNTIAIARELQETFNLKTC